MAKSTKQNPDCFDVPRGALAALKVHTKLVEIRNRLSLVGEFCDYRIDDVNEGDKVGVVYATIQFGRNEEHSGWLEWYEVQVCKEGKDWKIEPLH